MEEFLKKRSYLYHLKTISAIKNGHVKPRFDLPRTSAVNFNTFRQNISNLSNMNSTLTKLTPKGKQKQMLTPRKKSTQQIMNMFYVQKENLRLVQRIGTMTSQFNMKKYSNQYQLNKKMMRIHSKVKLKKAELIKFTIFDIKFQDHLADTQQIFSVYQILNNQKKKLLLKGDIFQLRKKQIIVPKHEYSLIKIQGKNCWGAVQILQKNLLSIKRNKEQVGSLVIDIV